MNCISDLRRDGVVVKGLGGLYEVVLDDGARVSSRARGSLHRDEKQKLLIGDRVTVLEAPGAEPVIERIHERRCELIRPPMANLDAIYAVIAAARPVPALETLDKLLAIAEHNGIRAALVVTKHDFDPAAAEEYAAIYRKIGIPVFTVSSESGEGIDALLADVTEELGRGHIAAFAGASGVGKSTLLNRLFPTFRLATGEISRRIERGKHTTRHVELFEMEAGGFLADTPGFSLLDFAHFDFFELDDLFGAFREFSTYRGGCRYVDCTHTGEGVRECAIARAVADGLIPESRHESYRSIYRTLKEKKRY